MKKITTLREKLQQDSDEFLLDALVETAAIAIVNDKDFSVENVIPLLLLSQYNHIAHLDADVTAIKQEQKMDERFVEVYKSILDIHHQISNQTKWIFEMGVEIVAILPGRAYHLLEVYISSRANASKLRIS